MTASASQRPPVKSDQQIFIELEQGWNEAFYHKDVAFIEGILADEFVATYDDGSRGDKARELALVTEFNQQVESAIPDKFTVRVYGDTAVVWFTRRLVGIRQGQAGRSDVSLHRRVGVSRRQVAMRFNPEHKGEPDGVPGWLADNALASAGLLRQGFTSELGEQETRF